MNRDDSPHAVAPTTAAIYIAAVQFLFVTTWTVYAVYLPQLLETAGLPRNWAPWILLLDQLVFLAADIATGVFADRVQRTLGRIGPWIVGATALSCLAFLLLPHGARSGGTAPGLMLALTLVWTLTSSALRAPPWVLLGRHAARPALPWLNALTLVGLAAGGAVAPYLGVLMKEADPRLPFAVSSLTLLAVTAGLVHIERGLARLQSASMPQEAVQVPRVGGSGHAAWMLGVLLMAAAYQAHVFVNAAPNYLRFAAPSALEWLLPLFWVGFGVAMLPGAALCRYIGAMPSMAAAALLGAAAALSAAAAASLPWLVAAQLATGAAWGCMLLAMFSSATERGRSGREGLALGTMFAMLALATLLRIGAVLVGVPADAALASALRWTPAALWGAGGVLVAMLARRAARRD